MDGPLALGTSISSAAPSLSLVAVPTESCSLPPASDRRSEVLRLIRRGVLVAVGTLGVSLMLLAGNPAHADGELADQNDSQESSTQAADESVETPTGVVSELTLLAPVTGLLDPVTDLLAPVIETVTPVVESVGVDVAPQPEATATPAAPATLGAPATDDPDTGAASAPTVLAPVTELLAPVTGVLAPIADSAVETEASQPNQSTVAQAAPASMDTATAESSSGVVPESTSTANDPAATTVLAASPEAAPPVAKSGVLAETVGALVDSVTSVTDSTAGANDPAATAVLAAGPAAAAAAADIVSGSVGKLLDVVKSVPGVDVVLPAGGDADVLAPVTGLVGGLDVLDTLQPVVGPVTAIVEPVVVPVSGLVEPVVAAAAPAVESLPVVGDLVDSTATRQPETATAASSAAAATPTSAPFAALTPVAVAAPTPVAAAAVATPVRAADATPTASQRSTTPAPSATPAAALSPSLAKISADSPYGGVGPSVETHVVSSDPYRDLAGVDHPALPRDVTPLAVGSTPGVNTATAGSASHGDQAVANATASPSGDSTGERVQFERADVRAGVAANRVPTPE